MKTLPVRVGIYDSRYTLTCHRDGSVTIKAPYVKWRNNSGSLAFSKTYVEKGKLANKVKNVFLTGNVMLSGYTAATLQDVVDGFIS